MEPSDILLILFHTTCTLHYMDAATDLNFEFCTFIAFTFKFCVESLLSLGRGTGLGYT